MLFSVHTYPISTVAVVHSAKTQLGRSYHRIYLVLERHGGKRRLRFVESMRVDVEVEVFMLICTLLTICIHFHSLSLAWVSWTLGCRLEIAISIAVRAMCYRVYPIRRHLDRYKWFEVSKSGSKQICKYILLMNDQKQPEGGMALPISWSPLQWAWGAQRL